MGIRACIHGKTRFFIERFSLIIYRSNMNVLLTIFFGICTTIVYRKFLRSYHPPSSGFLLMYKVLMKYLIDRDRTFRYKTFFFFFFRQTSKSNRIAVIVFSHKRFTIATLNLFFFFFILFK